MVTWQGVKADMEQLLVGVEIGGTKLQLALGKSDGHIVELIRGRVAENGGRLAILDWIKANMPALFENARQKGCGIAGIGVGFGGPIDSQKGTVIKSIQVPDWDDFKLKDWFEQEFGLPSAVFNDSSAAGWGEYILGSGSGKKQFFYANIGSGIGGALIIDGKLYDGQGYGAGEFGQMRVPDWTSEKPGVDVRLEAICSGFATEARLRTPGYVPENSLLMKFCSGDLFKISGKLFDRAVAEGDPFALRELDLIGQSIGTALAGVLSLFSPERIAIGGGMSLCGEPFFEQIRRHTKTREFVSNKDRYDIVLCQLGEKIVLHGAILLARAALC
jgi:glucokinase